MAGPRRRSREIALQIIHQMDVSPDLDAAGAMERYFVHLATSSGIFDDEEGGGAPAPHTIAGVASFDRALVDLLVSGVFQHREEIDETLTALSRNWRIERMAVVDRNIIRIALYELKYCAGVPVSVVINEAVELAKRFGTAEGAAFVNGLLDRAAGELHPQR